MKFLSHSIRTKNGFTLVEIIIGMTIFLVGMMAILTLLNSAISSSIHSKNEIIAANILREQVELLKNMRNTNMRNFAPWNTGISPNIYTIENNYENTMTTYVNGALIRSPIKLLVSPIQSNEGLAQKFAKSRIFTDGKGRFTHTVTQTGTNIASYIMVSPLKFTRPNVDGSRTNIEPKNSNGENQGYILDARVIIKSNMYREYDLKTVITDWQK